MQIFKITFEIKNREESEDEWREGFYFVEESVAEVQKYLSELYEEYDVRELLVLTANIPGWTNVPIQKGANG